MPGNVSRRKPFYVLKGDENNDEKQQRKKFFKYMVAEDNATSKPPPRDASGVPRDERGQECIASKDISVVRKGKCENPRSLGTKELPSLGTDGDRTAVEKMATYTEYSTYVPRLRYQIRRSKQ